MTTPIDILVQADLLLEVANNCLDDAESANSLTPQGRRKYASRFRDQVEKIKRLARELEQDELAKMEKK